MASADWPLNAPLIGGDKKPGRVTRDICAVLDSRPTGLWWAGFLFALSLLFLGTVAVSYQIATGIGTWGLNKTVGA